MSECKVDRTEYGAVDIMRLLCAYMVCILHIPLFVNRGGVFETVNFFFSGYICRLAVPFFFITSSYFFFLKCIN